MDRFSFPSSNSTRLRAFLRSNVFPPVVAFLLILGGWVFIILYFSQHRESLAKPSKEAPTETRAKEADKAKAEKPPRTGGPETDKYGKRKTAHDVGSGR